MINEGNPILSDFGVMKKIFDVIETALTMAGFKVMDGDHDRIIIRDASSDTDWRIKVDEELL